MSTEIIVFM